VSAREIDFRKLSPEKREQLLHLLNEPPLLSDPASLGFGVGWWVLAVLAVGTIALMLFYGVGVVTSPFHASVYAVLPFYFAPAVLAVWSILRAVRVLARRRAPWKVGRFLHTWGFVDTREGLRVHPIADFAGYKVVTKPASFAGLSFVTVTVRFAGDEESFLLAIADRFMERDLPRAALDELSNRRDTRFDEPHDAHARRSSPLLRHAFLASLPIAALGVAALHLQVLPRLSLAKSSGPWGWRAVKAAYRFGWVGERVDRAVGEQVDAARHALRTNKLALELLEDRARAGSSHVYVRLDTPEASEISAATAWLTKQAEQLGGKAAPIVLHYMSTSLALANDTPGRDKIIDALDAAARPFVSPELLQFRSVNESSYTADAPLLVVETSITPTGVFTSESKRQFAAVEFTFRARLERPGAPATPLGDPIRVPAATTISVSRLTFRGEKAVAIGGYNDDYLNHFDDAQVYTKQMSDAAAKAAPTLAARIF
jgi:hypothetical protein